MTANYSTATEAIIYLKDGKRKYGMLFNGNNDSYFEFVSNFSDDSTSIFRFTTCNCYLETPR